MKKPTINNIVTQEEYLRLFKIWSDSLFDITSRKNKDYAGPNDAFKNFKQIEILSNGVVSTEQGIFTRLSDKVSRIGTLLSKQEHVKEETILDTLDDLAVYAGILKLYLQTKEN